MMSYLKDSELFVGTPKAIIIPTKDIVSLLISELNKLPIVLINFRDNSEMILSEMMWKITDHQGTGLYQYENPAFPDDELLDYLGVHDRITREQTARALSSLCINVMQVLNSYDLLNYSVLRGFQRCSLVGRDLALIKL